MIKESERFYKAPLIIISENTIFAYKEGFSLTDFGIHVQRIFVDRSALREMNGEVSIELIERREKYIEEQCRELGIARQDKVLDILERQFNTIVEKRHCRR